MARMGRLLWRLTCQAQTSRFVQQQTRPFIYRTLNDVKKNDNIVEPCDGCESRRYLLRKDGLGFSLHQTILRKGKYMYMNYHNHLEAVFCTHGSGYVEVVNSKHNLGGGKRYPVYPGVMYSLNAHDKHWLKSDDDCDIVVVCAFSPPCDGAEKHQNGVFPYIGEDGKPDFEYWKKVEESGKKITIELDAGYSKQLAQ